MLGLDIGRRRGTLRERVEAAGRWGARLRDYVLRVGAKPLCGDPVLPLSTARKCCEAVPRDRQSLDNPGPKAWEACGAIGLARENRQDGDYSVAFLSGFCQWLLSGASAWAGFGACAPQWRHRWDQGATLAG